MIKKTHVLCGLAVVCAVFSGRDASASPATEAFIQQNFDTGYAILNSTSLSDVQKREQFRSLLLQLAASRRIALFILGPYAAGVAPAEIDSFVEAFTNYSIVLYEKGLNRYNGQALRVTGSSDRSADDSVVQAEIVGAKGSASQPINVAFRVRPNEMGTPTVIDVLFDGISLATVERAELTAFLLQHNGSVSELSKRLNTTP